LVPQHREVADRHPTIGEHHRQIGQHPTRRMRRAALPTSAADVVERLTDLGRRGDIRQQTRPDMGTNPTPAGGHSDLRIRRGTLRRTGAFLASRL
jgi:hypothetical protein